MSDTPTQSCSFCSKALADVPSLITGPDGVTICSECVLSGVDTVNVAYPTTDTCTFCHELKDDAHVASDDVRICASCMHLCVQILKEARGPLPAARVVRRK